MGHCRLRLSHADKHRNHCHMDQLPCHHMGTSMGQDNLHHAHQCHHLRPMARPRRYGIVHVGIFLPSGS
jgi:hypothetical protein